MDNINKTSNEIAKKKNWLMQLMYAAAGIHFLLGLLFYWIKTPILFSVVAFLFLHFIIYLIFASLIRAGKIRLTQISLGIIKVIVSINVFLVFIGLFIPRGDGVDVAPQIMIAIVAMAILVNFSMLHAANKITLLSGKKPFLYASVFESIRKGIFKWILAAYIIAMVAFFGFFLSAIFGCTLLEVLGFGPFEFCQ